MSLAKIKKQVFKNMSISDSIIPTSINTDIQKERQNATFNVEEFAEWWHGGVEKLKFKRFVDSYILEGTTEDPYRLQHSAHDEIYASGIKASIKVATKLRKLQEIRNPGGVDIWPGLYLSSQLWGALPRANPFSVHFAIALDAIRKQGTDEQFEMYGKRAENLEICFAFAQTELGHGTYLRGLETRADFERATDEFVMNTPTISSYKWWPGGSSSIAYKLTAVKLRQLFNEISLELKQGKYERVPELHAVSCCMKVLSSKDAAAGAERLRLACGGHGYLNSSGLASIYLDATAACTYEGENTVLLMTVGRYLMKMYRFACDGKMLPPSAEYLCEALRAGESVKWTGSWTNMLKILQTTAASKLRLAFENYLDGRNDGLSESDALSNAGIGVTQAAELHARCFVASTFFEEITGPQSKIRSPHLNQVMENLLELFLLNTVGQQLSHVLRIINMSAEDLCSLQKRLENALKKIRPEAVAICDGFDWHNRNLVSTLGCYDGNVYERIFEAAKSNPLNKQPVPEVFHTDLRPFLKSKI
ncbi:probable peroxisomal acyl-coenzyme A oxidase 1 [Stomoxys calcitrans]|uniref:probable peroxisomal acyl-coenzyme A oxidase 1 n=1 Tax=Stomoxys calcitrans TaxID=35570 RepID=UPI0027E28C90|nr:probable peroxisomal acyl-coenzyme A oxidase 1 [Stomoxys calcitrans]